MSFMCVLLTLQTPMSMKAKLLTVIKELDMAKLSPDSLPTMPMLLNVAVLQHLWFLMTNGIRT